MNIILFSVMLLLLFICFIPDLMGLWFSHKLARSLDRARIITRKNFWSLIKDLRKSTQEPVEKIALTLGVACMEAHKEHGKLKGLALVCENTISGDGDNTLKIKFIPKEEAKKLYKK